ncbi:MAG TPA: RNase adapter RapZ [Terriglobales bacterium]|nr:RNase adapter RapZ [Terriglobales bacterium]
MPTSQPAASPAPPPARGERHLVIITGLSGSGKGSVIKAFEDSGYYCVDNLPVDLLPKFVELVGMSSDIERAALVIDIREGQRLDALPALVRQLRGAEVRITLLFLEASDEALMRRFSETRRPHPLAQAGAVARAIRAERKAMTKIRAAADLVVDTSKFNVHELRNFITDRVIHGNAGRALRVAVNSFGFRNGVPGDADLVFDVRFLPNPNYIPQFRDRTGRDPQVAKYIRSFPQTREFMDRIIGLLVYLIPHYVEEGKSYLTIAFGCTGGQHRSVMIAEAIGRALARAGYNVKVTHRDMAR